jgi:glycosyltransferase involved in cell wall biosynthesis
MGGLSSGVKNDMELISVVIPCYNSGATLNQTVTSVQAQTWTSLEIIVVDDGSNDPYTCNVLAKLEGVSVVRQPNSGLPAARNAGFRAACGEYVLPLDADDWLEPAALETMMRLLKSSADACFVFCDLQLEGDASGVLRQNYNFFEQLSLNQLPYCLLMPKRVWIEAGGYDESMRNGYEDWEFNIRLSTLGYHGHRVAQPLLHYRVRSSGMLMSKSNRVHGRLWSEVQARHKSTYRWLNLISLWREWSGRPSRYPLFLHLVWMVLHRLLPVRVFSWLFRSQRQRSTKRRAKGMVG